MYSTLSLKVLSKCWGRLWEHGKNNDTRTFHRNIQGTETTKTLTLSIISAEMWKDFRPSTFVMSVSYSKTCTAFPVPSQWQCASSLNTSYTVKSVFVSPESTWFITQDNVVFKPTLDSHQPYIRTRTITSLTSPWHWLRKCLPKPSPPSIIQKTNIQTYSWEYYWSRHQLLLLLQAMPGHLIDCINCTVQPKKTFKKFEHLSRCPAGVPST